MTVCVVRLNLSCASERDSLLRALDSFRQYKANAICTYLQPRQLRLESLPPSARSFLVEELSYDRVLHRIEDAISVNASLASDILCNASALLASAIGQDTGLWKGTATDFDCSVARSCMRALFRDWSLEGVAERSAAHRPILDVLRQESDHGKQKCDFRVLVPGAGLGRLVHAVEQLGLSVEANDMSYQTLMIRMYLFGLEEKNAQKPLYPWALSFSNHLSRQDQLRNVMVPDVYPSNKIKIAESNNDPEGNSTERLVFTIGDFIELYSSPASMNAFSAVVTCFFIDTSLNFLDYASTAHNCLREGGIWINIGPLLWNTEENGPAGNKEGDTDEQESWNAQRHQSRTADGTSLVELTAEEVLLVLQKTGFVIEQADSNIGNSSYVGNPASLLQYSYNMVFWVARKKSVL
ncbi:hypothetical protein BLS_008687 [Venturia inaequalis]|uniref:carnosine N-methyltransferase n=1 Tax=Venturia inaequalis TaxID=5025 RepID=A0A8H3Z5L8_VENIN|nr:hypothetical protein BLS_008687 [Venturia inaequalis]KAE9984023.1 hypothetical protein EG328_009281 [Venturia inaequalis]